MHKNIRGALDVVLVVCAVVVAVTVVRRDSESKAVTSADETVDFEGWREDLDFARRIGGGDASYQVVVWMDYQCPACKAFEQSIAQVREHLGDSLAVVYRYYPLSSIHPVALEAAVAAECAREQGSFAAMHHVLFSMDLGTRLPTDSLIHAANIEDPSSFKACLTGSSSAANEAVQHDVERARSLGLIGTPAVQIGNRIATGGLTAKELESRLRAASLSK